MDRYQFDQKVLIFWIFIFALFGGCARPSHSGGESAPSAIPPVLATHSGLQSLIFVGPSSWSAEVDSLASILQSHEAGYREVSPDELESMSLDELLSYQALVVPGGDAPLLSLSLSLDTHQKLRDAVHRGLGYLGFCAGAWMAVSLDDSYGIGIVHGPIQQQTHFFNEHRSFTVDRISFSQGPSRNLLWYGGPVTPNFLHGVVARYSDGNPAVSQVFSDQGLVTLSGVHPAANALIADALGIKDVSIIDPEFAWQLMESTMRKIPMPAD
jgi:hypothetical protein